MQWIASMLVAIAGVSGAALSLGDVTERRLLAPLLR